MNQIVLPGKLAGKVEVPSSKSMAHRYLLCAALAIGGFLVARRAWKRLQYLRDHPGE